MSQEKSKTYAYVIFFFFGGGGEGKQAILWYFENREWAFLEILKYSFQEREV